MAHKFVLKNERQQKRDNIFSTLVKSFFGPFINFASRDSEDSFSTSDS